MSLSSHSFFENRLKYFSNTHNKVEQKHEKINGICDYIINPFFYFTPDIVNDKDIMFVTETITEFENYDGEKGSKTKKINVIYPINTYKDHNYFNSRMILMPIAYINEKRICLNCNKLIRKRKDEKKEYANRLGCVSCSRNLSRLIDDPFEIKKCGYLG